MPTYALRRKLFVVSRVNATGSPDLLFEHPYSTKPPVLIRLPDGQLIMRQDATKPDDETSENRWRYINVEAIDLAPLTIVREAPAPPQPPAPAVNPAPATEQPRRRGRPPKAKPPEMTQAEAAQRFTKLIDGMR